MIRRCDGTDPNLTRPLRPGENYDAGRCPWPNAAPCDCGKVFDDVERLTVYPHPLV